MRIVAGEFRGRTLIVPNTKDTRPTMDKTRQAVFNILRSASWAKRDNGDPILVDARVLDVFAGSGAMGFEALSQGAASCSFVENSKLALEAIQKNIDKIGLAAHTHLIPKDVLILSNNSEKPFDIAFLDPPYNSENMIPAITALRAKNYIDAKTLLVLEMPKKAFLVETPDVTILDTRQYGVSKIIFAHIT